MCSAIVLSTDKHNYRKVAQQHYGLTDEQMKDMDVHQIHQDAKVVETFQSTYMFIIQQLIKSFTINKQSTGQRKAKETQLKKEENPQRKLNQHNKNFLFLNIVSQDYQEKKLLIYLD